MPGLVRPAKARVSGLASWAGRRRRRSAVRRPPPAPARSRAGSPFHPRPGGRRQRAIGRHVRLDGDVEVETPIDNVDLSHGPKTDAASRSLTISANNKHAVAQHGPRSTCRGWSGPRRALPARTSRLGRDCSPQRLDIERKATALRHGQRRLARKAPHHLSRCFAMRRHIEHQCRTTSQHRRSEHGRTGLASLEILHPPTQRIGR